MLAPMRSSLTNYQGRRTDCSSLSQILRDELQEIHGIDADATNLREAIHNASPRTALCLSGCGDRSAAFGLGVIRWLARADLLERFHYMSTVSGGGYIGSWLSAWICNAPSGYETVKKRFTGTIRLGTEAFEIKRLGEQSLSYPSRRHSLSRYLDSYRDISSQSASQLARAVWG